MSVMWTHLSNVSSSSWFKSQAMYSRAASVIRGHHDKSRLRSFCKFSAISSTPSSVILLQPESDRTVRFGSECTILTTPWLVSSQQDWSLRMLSELLCFGEKYPRAASVT